MHLKKRILTSLLTALCITQGNAQQESQWTPPPVPVGYDAYLQWDKWAQQRLGVRAYMRSTYDRQGNNYGWADASHFLYQESDTFNVTLDVEGPGMLYFARYNHWHGSPWHYEVDGTDYIVQETATAAPVGAKGKFKKTVFMPEKAFPTPLALTWSTTKGADLSWVPIGFTESFRMAYSRTFYGTGYYIFHQFAKGIPLSRPIEAWNDSQEPDKRVVNLLNNAGKILVPRASSDKGKAIGLRELSGKLDALPKNKVLPLARIENAPAQLRLLELSIPHDQADAFARAGIRMTWDNRAFPSVDAPIAQFFGAGSLFNNSDREFLVKSLPMQIRFGKERIYLTCQFPMPFFRSAQIELVGHESKDIKDIKWHMRYASLDAHPSDVAYFHATYVDHGPDPVNGKDLVLLDTRGTEGSDVWSGHFVGTSYIFSHNAELKTLEGDPRFFFDDSLTPQAQGTGSEEWGGGGDYWGGNNMTLHLAGHPVGSKNLKLAKSDLDKIQSAYRFLLADLMPFGRNARIQLEHGAVNEWKEHYETVTYWYGVPSASLIKTDSLQIGDIKSEKKHAYNSPKASDPYSIKSRYEWGPDHEFLGKWGWKKKIPRGKEVIPEHTDIGRKTTGSSEFTVSIEPNNFGVMLRRKLDYRFPNQRAEVYIADASDGQNGKDLKWQPAGAWYTAGSNVAVHSHPEKGGELGKTEHNVRPSNRWFRDDEFLLPLELTQGRSKIRVKVNFTPIKRPLFPGHPMKELAWSEIRYDVYSYVQPAPVVEP